MAVRSLLALVAGTVALASACAGPTGSPASMRGPSDSGPAAEPTSPGPSSPPAEVPRELRFTEPRLGGGTVRGADFAGHDLVMWFWAPW